MPAFAEYQDVPAEGKLRGWFKWAVEVRTFQTPSSPFQTGGETMAFDVRSERERSVSSWHGFTGCSIAVKSWDEGETAQPSAPCADAPWTRNKVSLRASGIADQ